MTSEFFDYVRTHLFGGSLNQYQVDGLNKIVEFGIARGTPRAHLAYILATAYHESAHWMQPIREGGRRRGPAYTDASAKRAVASIHAKGIIRTNYALPDGPWRKSYYGRGLVQITWFDNYLKLGQHLGLGNSLAKDPDMALEWDVALNLLFMGMEDGLYRTRKSGKTRIPEKLSNFDLPRQFKEARNIINGDVSKNGAAIAREASHFFEALATVYPDEAVCTCKTCPVHGGSQ